MRRGSKFFVAAALVLAAASAFGQVSGDSGDSSQSAASGLSDHQVALKAKAEAATQTYLQIIKERSGQYGVDPALVMAVITVESSGDPNSVSSSGAMGLMQLMPGTCSDFSVQDPFDPDSNIRGGIALLASHSKRYKGNLQKVLAAYNAGARHADDGSWVLISQTRHYVPAVLAYYEALKGSVDALPFADEPPVTLLPPDSARSNLPLIHYGDMIFDALRTSQNVADPAGLAENSDLEEVASALTGDYLEGKVTDKNLQNRALHRLHMAKRNPKTLKAYCLTTPGPTDFTTAWDKQAPVSGNLVGAAHVETQSGHVWIVLIASYY